MTSLLVKLLGPAMATPSYRTYWFGTLASVLGFQMLNFSQFWVIHELTHSPLYLGYVGVANAVPAILLNVFGGVLADRINRQKLIIFTQTVNSILILVLAVLVLYDVVEAWHVITIAFITGGINAFDQPARQALYPSLVERNVLMNAVALNTAIWTGTRIVAPAVAGIVITLTNTATAFTLSAIGFLTMAIVVLRMTIPGSSITGKSGLTDLLDGFRFLKRHKVFMFLIGLTFLNSFFGMAYIPMMPVFAVDILKVGADGQGILMAFGGVGAVVSTLVIGRITNLTRRGLLVIGGSFIFGSLIGVFALTSALFGNYYLALSLMFLVGLSSSAYLITIMSSLQLLVPDHMRGRIMGFFGMTWSIMPLGGMYAGSLAKYLGGGANGVAYSIALGGLLIALFAIGPALYNKEVRSLSRIVEENSYVVTNDKLKTD